ncbi:hypothetical protein GCM10010234_17510 [Streptomyces hawaiiensis]
MVGKALFTCNERVVPQAPEGHPLLRTLRSHDQWNTVPTATTTATASPTSATSPPRRASSCASSPPSTGEHDAREPCGDLRREPPVNRGRASGQQELLQDDELLPHEDELLPHEDELLPQDDVLLPHDEELPLEQPLEVPSLPPASHQDEWSTGL